MEIGAARSVLRVACAALDRHFAGRYFLIDGTLLGHVRDGGFILGDNDIDLGMRIEDFDEGLIDDMAQAGLPLLRREGEPERGLVLQFLCDGIRLDLSMFYRDDDDLVTFHHIRGRRLAARVPDFATAPARFEGVDVAIPTPPERYLIAAYGHKWRRPVRVWDYRYAMKNLTPDGGPAWRLHFRIKRALWRLKYRDIHVGGRTVFTDGVFDLIHANHIALLEEAKAMGDRLLVGVISDRIAASYKRQPVVPEGERLRMVKALASVDQAILLDDPLDEALMRRIVAMHDVDLVVYAGDATPEFYTWPEVLGIMRRLPYHDGVSTSALIQRIRCNGANGP